MKGRFLGLIIGLCFAVVPAFGQHRSPWPAIREFGGAIPKNESSWVSVDDYPVEALRKDQQGNVIVEFDITADGRAENCKVTTSSGVASLDRVPCRLIERKARFKPATTESGSPIATKARYSTAFWIP